LAVPPNSIKSYVDSQLEQMEDRMSSLLYKQAVEQDMVAGILAESVKNVKRTNGRISLGQCVRDAW
jgi:DNA-binding transcriptional regulator/RsmH inhibitor MraZ